MTFYIGRPGALVALPLASRGRKPVWARRSSVQDTLGGGRVVQFAPDGRRTYDLAWQALTLDQLSVFERFATGAAGPGPYTLIDPERRNMLTLNQSSAGSATSDASGLSVVAGSGETVGVQSAVVQQGPKTFRWSVPRTVLSGRLLFDPPAPWLLGFPVPSSEPWTFSAWLRGSGADPVLDVAAVFRWLDVTGAVAVAETVGTPASIDDNSWAQVMVNRTTPPPGAAYLTVELRLNAGTVSAPVSGIGMTRLGTERWSPWRALTGGWAHGATSYLAAATNDWVFGSTVDVLVDQPQLDMYDGVRPWVLGTGMPQVSWLDLPDQYDLINQHNLTATLVEVG